MNSKFIKYLIKIIHFSLVAFTIFLIIVVFFKKEWVEIAFLWLKTVVTGFGLLNIPLVFLIASIETFPVLGMIIPWQQAMLIVWWTFGLSYIWLAILSACGGALVGNFVGYLLWRIYWDKFFAKYWNWIWIWTTEVKYIKSSIQKNWPIFLILGKFHNTTRAFIPFIAWSMGMNNRLFWIYNFVWSILWAILIILLWTLFVEHYKIILEYIDKIFLGIFLVIIIYVYTFKKDALNAYVKEKEKEFNI